MYFLEVSSPGIERILRKEKHFEEAQGKEIEIKLFKPIEKQKEYIKSNVINWRKDKYF